MKTTLTLWRGRPIPAQTPYLFIGGSDVVSVWRVPIGTLDATSADHGYLPYSDDTMLAYFVGTESDGFRYWSEFSMCCRVGDYGYFVLDYADYPTERICIAKVNLSTWESSGTVDVGDTGEECAWAQTISSDGTYLYVVGGVGGAATGAMGIWKIQLSDFTYVDFLDLSASWSVYSSAKWVHDLNVCDTDYLYVFAEEISAEPKGTYILRIQLSDFTYVDSLNVGEGTPTNTGYVNVTNGVVEGDYLYCGARDQDSATSSAKLLKIDRSTFTVTSALAIKTIDTDADDGVCSITSDGTYLYAATAGGGTSQEQSILGKVQLSDFTLVATADYADVDHPNIVSMTQPIPKQGTIVDGKLYLIPYYFIGTGPPNVQFLPIWEIDTADLTTLRNGMLDVTNNSYPGAYTVTALLSYP